MKKTKKLGFREYISKSLPLPSTRLIKDEKILLKDDLVFYYKDSAYNMPTKRYGKIQYITPDGSVYCYWESRPGFNSWGWMPKDKVFIDSPGGVVPIITLQFDSRLQER